MKENKNKREGLLLGRLNRFKDQAPQNIVTDWTPDGTSIRALGVPMGNKLDEEEWWLKRYRIVKARIAAWKSLSHLSITGRCLLLQAILYGSLRYWLFTMRMPESLHAALDKDSYNLLWAQQPEILSDEDGTTAKTRAYIHRRASYLPQKQGGGGVMHFRSHAQAYYAQWIRRYLEPGDQPWKKVADRWLATSIHGRGALLINNPPQTPTLPPHATYLRQCLISFSLLNMRQDTNVLTHTVQSEPIFNNWRFTINIPPEIKKKWIKHVGLLRIHNAINATSPRIFTDSEMEVYTLTYAPPKTIGTGAQTAFSDQLMATWPLIRAAITPEIVHAATSKDVPVHGDYLHLERPNYSYYVLLKIDAHGNNTYHKLWLDARNSPHDTGDTVNPDVIARATITQAAVWRTIPTDDDEDDAQPKAVDIRLGGAVTQTFPSPNGWTTHTPDDGITSLTHLNISNITKHFTTPHIRGLRPNCEIEWANPDPKHHRLPNTRVPWDKVWESLGTPISDATEERHWRKLLHRGTFVRNKQSDKSKPTVCRMIGCHKEESMLHIVQCQKLKPFWDLVFNFITPVIGDPPPKNRSHAIIFNMWTRDDLGSESACAFLRHAFGCFYNAFSKVDLEQKLFSTPLVFLKTLLSFRSAVLRYAQTIRILYLQRRYTTLRTKLPPPEARDRFKALVVIQETFYDFELSTAFSKAISDDEAAMAAHYALPPTAPNPGAAGPS